jgi:hypothetical protein
MFSKESRHAGIYHIHSDFSYDGTNSLEEISQWAGDHGLVFVLLTEHDLGFDQEKFRKYRAECTKNSGKVLLVPGIEYEVIHDGAVIHVGAIGVSRLLDESLAKQGLESLVGAIHQYGGLAVLHHPNNIRKVLTKKLVDLFDFIEVWNTKFDCGFGPNFQFLRWLQHVECQGPYLVSADIHDIGRFKQDNIAFIDMEGSGGLQLSTIVQRLKERSYRCRVGNWVVFPDAAWQVPNFLYRILPFVCLVKKKLFRVARFAVPEKYRKAVFKFVNRSWIR